MNVHRLGPWMIVMSVAACGDDGGGTDPGDGSRTLLVDGDIDAEEGGADFAISVRRAGADVTDAVVRVTSSTGEVVLIHDGGGLYRGSQAGWGGSYHLTVEAGDDWLDGSIAAPDLPVLLHPNASEPFDPHLAEDLIVMVRWDGDPAQLVRVRTRDFDGQDLEDAGELGIPAMMFQESEDEVEIRRRNSVILEGGAPGSSLDASAETLTTIFVTNPFPS